MIPPDQEILDLLWEELPKEKHPSKEPYVFLSVDVIGHSKLFEDKMKTDQLLERHNLLLNLRTYVRECFQKPWNDAIDLEWDWAGDGGIYAYPTRKTTLYVEDKMFLVAQKIVAGLPAFNRDVNPIEPIELRIVLDLGEGFRYHEPQLRRGAALNFVAKLRVPGERTSISITHELWTELDERHQSLFRRIEVSEQTTRKVYVHMPTKQEALAKEIEAMADVDVMQAAHLAYRLGALYFGAKEREFAIREFGHAIELLDRVDQRHRYYYRTMYEFYSLWRQLAIEIPESLFETGDDDDRRKMLQKYRTRGFFQNYDSPGAWELLFEMEFCIEQLDILARRPVSDPIGLTSLQICLLLERVGYPRRWHGAAISQRIQRIEAELDESVIWKEKENGLTIDMACGLCSAVAASCLALDQNDRADALVDWLASKSGSDYRYRGQNDISSRSPSDEHAMHYAAAVLQAFVDHGIEKNADRIDDVLHRFFDDATEDRSELPDHWIQYRNISLADFCGIVFPTFARTILARGPFTKDRTKVLEAAVEVMASLFSHEIIAGRLFNTPGRLYAGRDNLGSFGCGLLVGFPGQAAVMFRGFRTGMAKVSNDILPDEQRKRTIDSNLDRIRKWLDGWLLQWECALYLREAGRAIEPVQLRDLFATSPRRKDAPS